MPCMLSWQHVTEQVFRLEIWNPPTVNQKIFILQLHLKLTKKSFWTNCPRSTTSTTNHFTKYLQNQANAKPMHNPSQICRGIHPPLNRWCILHISLYISPHHFHKFMFYGLIYVFWLLPYFDHDAFMHHALQLHVLDVPANSDVNPCP